MCIFLCMKNESEMIDKTRRRMKVLQAQIWYRSTNFSVFKITKGPRNLNDNSIYGMGLKTKFIEIPTSKSNHNQRHYHIK